MTPPRVHALRVRALRVRHAVAPSACRDRLSHPAPRGGGAGDVAGGTGTSVARAYI
jgi:hypothetical protein